MKDQKIDFIVGNISVLGGVEKVTQILSHEFVTNGARITIHSLYSQDAEYPIWPGIKIHHYGLTPPDRETNLFSKVKRLLLNGLTLRSKLLVSSGSFIFQGFYMAAYLPLLNIPSRCRIVCEHNTYDAPGRISRIARLFIYKIFGPHLIVLTEADFKSYSRAGIRNITKIHNPSPFSISKHSKADQLQGLISVGRFTYQKRFNLMIELCSSPLKSHSDWKLYIQGEGEDLETLKSTANSSTVLSQIAILPAGDTRELYQKGAIFLMTSKFEGLPMTLIESMSFGIPAVCFNCSPGLSEIIEDGVNGYLVEMNDHTSFIDKVTKLMDNPALRREMGDNATLTAKKFAVAKIISDWEKVFK